MSVELSDIHLGYSVEVMPSAEVPEPSSVVGSVGAELLTAEVSPILVSSSSSSEKLDYSKDDDVDILLLLPVNIPI